MVVVVLDAIIVRVSCRVVMEMDWTVRDASLRFDVPSDPDGVRIVVHFMC